MRRNTFMVRYTNRLHSTALCLLLSFLAVPLGYAKEVSVAFSLDIPPYIIETSSNGIEIDIFREALAYKGHSLKPSYLPLARLPIAFQEGRFDAIMSDAGVDLETKTHAFYGAPAVIYHNVFITLKNRNLRISQPSDLDALSIASFQGAEKRYPQWLSKAVKEKRFFGASDQLVQIKLLNLKRYDVVLSDRYIFRYFLNQARTQSGMRTFPTIEHEFTHENPEDYRPVFREKSTRNDFNEGLKQLKLSGRFQEIYDQYMK